MGNKTLDDIHEAIFKRKRNKAIELYCRYALVNWEEGEEFIGKLELELLKTDRDKFGPETNWKKVWQVSGIMLVLIVCAVVFIMVLRLFGRML